MENYSFGNVDIEFKTNKIFLLMQMLYRWDRIENKINDEDNALSHLAKLMENFKKILAENDEGLKEFNVYKYNAEYNDMWAEYGKYIENFAQIDIEEIRIKNPQMAKAIEELMKTDFFKKVEDINNQYSKKMEKRFMEQTRGYKTEADDIVGKTKVRKIIYMPFDPDLIDIQPMYLTDKNENGEYAVQFSIPTDKEKFKESFEMEYRDGVESVILFHEKLHADIPPQPLECFENPMQCELDSHLRHSIIELLANGEMGINIAGQQNIFQNTLFHIGKIPYEGRYLKTSDLPSLAIKDNELLHIQAKEKYGEYSDYEELFSEEEMGIIKIRGMMYPYVLMYKNRHNDAQFQTVIQEIERDSEMLQNIYGKEFLAKIRNREFLLEAQKSVQQYDSLSDFAEGMSKELLGIEQVRKKEQVKFSEEEIGNVNLGIEVKEKEKAISRITSDINKLIEGCERVE